VSCVPEAGLPCSDFLYPVVGPEYGLCSFNYHDCTRPYVLLQTNHSRHGFSRKQPKAPLQRRLPLPRQHPNLFLHTPRNPPLQDLQGVLLCSRVQLRRPPGLQDRNVPHQLDHRHPVNLRKPDVQTFHMLLVQCKTVGHRHVLSSIVSVVHHHANPVTTTISGTTTCKHG
jgi:hypothetical protein